MPITGQKEVGELMCKKKSDAELRGDLKSYCDCT